MDYHGALQKYLKKGKLIIKNKILIIDFSEVIKTNLMTKINEDDQLEVLDIHIISLKLESHNSYFRQVGINDYL